MSSSGPLELEALTPRYMAWYRFTRNPTAIIGAAMVNYCKVRASPPTRRRK